MHVQIRYTAAYCIILHLGNPLRDLRHISTSLKFQILVTAICLVFDLEVGIMAMESSRWKTQECHVCLEVFGHFIGSNRGLF